jgi:hypothetical protein
MLVYDDHLERKAVRLIGFPICYALSIHGCLRASSLVVMLNKLLFLF